MRLREWRRMRKCRNTGMRKDVMLKENIKEMEAKSWESDEVKEMKKKAGKVKREINGKEHFKREESQLTLSIQTTRKLNSTREERVKITSQKNKIYCHFLLLTTFLKKRK